MKEDANVRLRSRTETTSCVEDVIIHGICCHVQEVGMRCRDDGILYWDEGTT